MKTSLRVLSATLAIALLSGSCSTNPYTGEKEVSKTAIAAAIGSLAGAGIGALTGDDSKERRQRALIGAGIGAVAGGGVGLYMDRQEAKLREELRGTGVSISRRGDQVILNMPGNITFETASDQISLDFAPVLTSVTKVVAEFDKTLVDVGGHTDNVGAADYNLNLSKRRADRVADFLRGKGVHPARLVSEGYGFKYPIASNDSEAGRQQNRRVEISLRPLQ
ncbi:MAG: outer membrane protein OmpA-like peptidoglycan-associated protein [Verrucomicrobiales bacterium]|jgi:outer membrane protein OmpA-like peptidoglycan-associated protein